MNLGAALPAGLDPVRIQQGIKWTVYTLLLINFGYYIAEDMNRALHTLGPEAGFLDWTGAFATSIDEAGWFLLLFMFELETYILGNENWTGWVARIVHGTRMFCYLLLGHTVYAYFIAATALQSALPAGNIPGPCDLADTGVSWVRNLAYTEISAQNCGDLSQDDGIYWLEPGTVVSDRAGLDLERQLAWVDLSDAIVWLAVVLAIEVVVRLQNRGITEGLPITLAKRAQIILYAILIADAIYWATLTHWLYAWDQFIWIGGFAAIEMNISEWRREILEERAT